jgi:hypothetical protein
MLHGCRHLRSTSFANTGPIDYAYSLMSSLLVGAERFFALSVQRVHPIAFRSYVDRTLVAAWHLWSTLLVLCEIHFSHGAFVMFH